MTGHGEMMTPDSLDDPDTGQQPTGRGNDAALSNDRQTADMSHSSEDATAQCDQENINYKKLCRLHTELAPEAMRQVFNNIHPAISLVETLARPSVTVQLRRLRALGLLCTDDWEILYPHKKSQVSSVKYNPTLLYLLLRTISPLTAPYPDGWHGLPLHGDTSISADLVRLQWFRTLLVNKQRDTESRMNDKEFKAYWQQIKDILVRTGGTTIKLKVDRMERENGAPTWISDKDYIKLLQSWDDQARDVAAREADIDKMRAREGTDLSQLTSGSFSEYNQQHSGTSPTRKSTRLPSETPDSSNWQKTAGKETSRRASHHYTKEVNTLTKAELQAHERTVLLKFYRQLTEVVQSDDVIPKLIQRSLMSHEEKNRINLATRNSDRMKMVLELLAKKSGNTFDKFCDVIKYKYKKLSDQMIKAKQSPLNVEKPDEKTQCRTALGLAYKSMLQTISPIPWHREINTTFKEFLVPFHITDFYGRLVSQDHLFSQHPKCERPKRLLLEGLDGVGKSTLLRHLAHQWCTGVTKGHFLQRFKLVFLVDLRKVTGSLMDSLTEQCLGPGGYIRSPSELHALLEADHENILFLLDGYEDINNIESDVWDLVHRELYPSSSLILATNTHSVTSRILKNFDTHLVLLGVQPDTQEDIVKRYADLTHTSADKYTGLLARVTSEQNSTLRTLSLNPLYALCLCLVAQLGGSLDFHSLSQMMASIVSSVQMLHCQVNSDIISEDSVPDDVKEAFSGLEKVAFNKMLVNQVLVPHPELMESTGDNADASIATMISFGLLKLVDDSGMAGLHGDKAYQFVHRIFQEFLAARHLSHMEPEEFSAHVDGLVNERHLHKVATFFCGIQRYDHNLRTLRDLFQGLAQTNMRLLSRRTTRDTVYSGIFSTDTKRDSPYLRASSKNTKQDNVAVRTEGRMSSVAQCLECLAEAEGREDLLEIVQDKFPWRLYMKHRVHQSPLTVVGLGQVLKSNMTSISELELRLDHVGAYYEHFYMVLADSIEKNTHLLTLKIRWTTEDLLAIFLANVFGQNKSLRHLHLTDESQSAQDNVSATVWSNLWTAGNNMKHLKTMAFTNCKNPAIVTSFIRNSPPNLNNFYLNSCKVDLIGSQELSNKIEKSKDLRFLNLSAVKLKRSDFLYLAYGLKLNKSITELILSDVQLDETSALALAEAVELNTTLKRLDLQKVGLTVESCRALGYALSVNQSILEVDLRQAPITDQGAKLLWKLKRDSALLPGLDHKKVFGTRYSIDEPAVITPVTLPAIKT